MVFILIGVALIILWSVANVPIIGGFLPLAEYLSHWLIIPLSLTTITYGLFRNIMIAAFVGILVAVLMYAGVVMV